MRKSRLGSVGNALHQLRAYSHPHVKHLITQTIQQADEEALIDPDDRDSTVVNIQRQAVKIQRGDQVDQIMALLRNEENTR
jgi:dUTPase